MCIEYLLCTDSSSNENNLVKAFEEKSMCIEYLLCTDHSSNVNNFMEAFEEKSVCISNICYVLIIHQM
jgi:hypothetical protein